jgi:Protein of unknown function (DUF4087)
MKNNVTKPISLVVCYPLLAAVVVVYGQSRPAGGSAVKRFETRCGWFSNPTPANISLYDRDGEWIIGAQGGYQVERDWDWPSFKDSQWVKTNVNYGYGCACMQLRVNRRTTEVLEIKSVRARPLAVCRRDPSLKKWKSYLDP